ncbi:hypothetical protein HK405_001840 [Cladochytrium tenue]|nr:hypothetical protein HK405_001840 [Cladochytrium tenue]
MSIGGWTFSKHFSSAAATPASRAAFIAGTLAILHGTPSDGASQPGDPGFEPLFTRVDLDWEHVSPAGSNHGAPGNETRPDDGENYAALLRELRAALDADAAAAGGRWRVELSACVVADPDKMTALPLGVMAECLDTLNVMTYDFASSAWGSTVAGHHANAHTTWYAPLSAERAVDHLLSRGVPASKLAIGVALYARGFAGASAPGDACGGAVPADLDAAVYAKLPPAGFSEAEDATAGATYAVGPNPADGGRPLLLSYETPASVRAKCRLVAARGLQGVFVWEAAGDVRDAQSPRCVLRALADGLRAPMPQGF